MLINFLFAIGACSLPPVPEAAEYEISENTSTVSTVREENHVTESDQYQGDLSVKVNYK